MSNIVPQITSFSGPHGKTRVPDLDGGIHFALKQERWLNMAQHRFDALRQSLLFATNLLRCSDAALSCFFPKVLDHPQRNIDNTLPSKYIAGPPDDDKDFTPATLRQMRTAEHHFRMVASSITWVESPEIFSTNGWMGITSSGLDSPEVKEPDWYWEKARERDEGAGHRTRQITIAIASEFVDAILTSKPDSEKHLFATFYAGINIVHELGHFWAIHQYDTVLNPAWGAPFVGNYLDRELGDAYVSWLFGGFIPHPMGNGTNECSFDQGMQWIRVHEVGMTDSGYDIRYSMNISHIERMLSHDEWKIQFKQSNPARARRGLLHPQVPFRINETARIVKWREYELTGMVLDFDVNGLAKKDDQNFVDYSLCPLGFCDLDWNDVPRHASEHSADPSGSISELSNDAGKMPEKPLGQRKTLLETWLSTTEENARKLGPKRARDQTASTELDGPCQKRRRPENRSCGDSYPSVRVKQDSDAEDKNPELRLNKKKLAPLPPAVRLFFQHDIPEGHRQKLENKLRLYHHKKQTGAGDEDEYDSDGSLLAVELHGDDDIGTT
jgi:hypothetical protein